MSFFTIILLAFSVSADAFAVAISIGISEKKIYLRQALALALCFGVFQAIMPIIGYETSLLFGDIIEDFDHWIAFVLLGYIGGNMVREGWNQEEKSEHKKNIFGLKSLLLLGIATSIDALAVGVSLIATADDIYFPAIVIGITTALLSYIGVQFGKNFGGYIGKRAEMIGGIILIGIGARILIEHLFFA